PIAPRSTLLNPPCPCNMTLECATLASFPASIPELCSGGTRRSRAAELPLGQALEQSPEDPLMRIRILYHDHCFDGAASAALFSRFLEDKFHPDAEFHFTGLAHKADQLFEPGLFDGDVNAIVDF